jgi:uncharacterized RDD family membrane protein YckC
MSQSNEKPIDAGFTLRPQDESRFDDPVFWEGSVLKRLFGYVIDVLALAVISTGIWIIAALTLGLLAPIAAVLTTILPFAYHTLFISQRGQTIGQRFAGVRVVDAATGANPSLIQAFLLTVLFYVSLTLAFVPLLYILFDPRDRFLHDILSNTRALNAETLAKSI